MKRLIALLLAALLLLSGCTGQKNPDSTTEATQGTAEGTNPAVTEPDETTVPSEATDPTQSTESTEPTEPVTPGLPDYGLYQPDSEIEIDTDGALRAYPLTDLDCYAAVKMGSGLLLFCGKDSTDLIYVTEQGRYTADLGELQIVPTNCAFTTWENGLSYYDMDDNAMVFLDAQLRETARVRLPEAIQGYPALSDDRSMIYYCTADAIRVLEISTGISRLLRQMTYNWQALTDTHLDGSVLQCFVVDNGRNTSLYLSAETGEALYQCDDFPALDTDRQTYFVQYWDGSVQRMMYGDLEAEQTQCLVPQWYGDAIAPVLEMDSVVIYGSDDRGMTFKRYDLEDGTCDSRVSLPEDTSVWNVFGDPQNDRIWFLGESDGEAATLYCWDWERSPSGDKTAWMTPVYTPENPDSEGLAACQAMADKIGEKYGVKILLWQDAARIQPHAYTYEPEHLTQAYLRDLSILDQALSRYPKAVLRSVAQSSDNGVLTVSLVRGIRGSNEMGTPTAASGVQFWLNGNNYLALALGSGFEQAFYHELFHVMDSRVFAQSNAYDNWNSLNPEGFAYDLDYVANQYREDKQYLEGENRAFVDTYSMSFPKEDRARIMEYAMLDGCADVFESDIMQAKLKKLCQGIRETFGLKGYTEPLPWEQYLEEA